MIKVKTTWHRQPLRKIWSCGSPTPSHRAAGRVSFIHASGRIAFAFTFTGKSRRAGRAGPAKVPESLLLVPPPHTLSFPVPCAFFPGHPVPLHPFTPAGPGASGEACTPARVLKPLLLYPLPLSTPLPNPGPHTRSHLQVQARQVRHARQRRCQSACYPSRSPTPLSPLLPLSLILFPHIQFPHTRSHLQVQARQVRHARQRRCQDLRPLAANMIVPQHQLPQVGQVLKSWSQGLNALWCQLVRLCKEGWAGRKWV